MNYTPGPWTVSISDDARIEDRITTADGAPVFVGRFVNYDNARLVAAATDLLAALESLNAAVIRAGYGNTAMPELTQAWAAIAKATGETEK